MASTNPFGGFDPGDVIIDIDDHVVISVKKSSSKDSSKEKADGSASSNDNRTLVRTGSWPPRSPNAKKKSKGIVSSLGSKESVGLESSEVIHRKNTSPSGGDPRDPPVLHFSSGHLSSVHVSTVETEFQTGNNAVDSTHMSTLTCNRQTVTSVTSASAEEEDDEDGCTFKGSSSTNSILQRFRKSNRGVKSVGSRDSSMPNKNGESLGDEITFKGFSKSSPLSKKIPVNRGVDDGEDQDEFTFKGFTRSHPISRYSLEGHTTEHNTSWILSGSNLSGSASSNLPSSNSYITKYGMTFDTTRTSGTSSNGDVKEVSPSKPKKKSIIKRSFEETQENMILEKLHSLHPNVKDWPRQVQLAYAETLKDDHGYDVKRSNSKDSKGSTGSANTVRTLRLEEPPIDICTIIPGQKKIVKSTPNAFMLLDCKTDKDSNTTTNGHLRRFKKIPATTLVNPLLFLINPIMKMRREEQETLERVVQKLPQLINRSDFVEATTNLRRIRNFRIVLSIAILLGLVLLLIHYSVHTNRIFFGIGLFLTITSTLFFILTMGQYQESDQIQKNILYEEETRQFEKRLEERNEVGRKKMIIKTIIQQPGTGGLIAAVMDIHQETKPEENTSDKITDKVSSEETYNKVSADSSDEKKKPLIFGHVDNADKVALHVTTKEPSKSSSMKTLLGTIKNCNIPSILSRKGTDFFSESLGRNGKNPLMFEPFKKRDDPLLITKSTSDPCFISSVVPGSGDDSSPAIEKSKSLPAIGKHLSSISKVDLIELGGELMPIKEESEVEEESESVAAFSPLSMVSIPFKKAGGAISTGEKALTVSVTAGSIQAIHLGRTINEKTKPNIIGAVGNVAGFFTKKKTKKQDLGMDPGMSYHHGK